LPLNERLVVNTSEAAAMLGVSRDTFREIVVPEIRAVPFKQRRHWPVAELERWVASRMEASPFE
jgi:predicted DNA-binding transcriptional regulator AlpA